MSTYISVPTLVARMRQELNDQPWQDTLATALTDGTGTAIDLNNSAKWGQGNIAEFDDGSGEQVRIIKSPPVNAVADMTRAYNGTTGAAHLISCPVLKNPTYGFFEMQSAIYNTVREDLTRYVWTLITDDVTPTAIDALFSAPADAIGIIEAVQKQTSTITDVYHYGPATARVLLDPHIPTSIFATGKAWRFPDGFDNITNTVTISYQAPVTTATMDEDTGVAQLVLLGACYRVLRAHESKVSAGRHAEGQRPSDTNVNPGMILRDAAFYKQEFLIQRANVRRILEADGIPIKRRVKTYGWGN